MCWTRFLKSAAATAIAANATASMAGTIVIRASGPSAKLYPVGKSIPEGQKLVLRAGDTLVLLDGRGTRTLTGAGSYDVGANAAGTTTSGNFAALISNAGGRQVRTGAVRGTGTTAPRVTNIWYVDTAKSGTICLRDMSRATLWRAAIEKPAAMTLTRVSDGKSLPLVFAAGQAVRSWPVNDIPLVAGTEYRITTGAAEKPVAVQFALVTFATEDVVAVAADLISKGCSVQIEALVEAGRASSGTG